jgi:SAM-dependent methyltransferase
VHPAIREFVADVAEAVELRDPIVEFGSLQVEPGQDADLRRLFPGRTYVGTDMREGPGVDRVEDLLALSFGDGEVGTAICVETLEHVTDPPAACRELARVVAAGGVAIVSAPTLLGVHAYPDDYFRFLPRGLETMLSGFDQVWSHGLGDPELPMWALGLTLERLPRTQRRQEEFAGARGRFRLGPTSWPARDVARALLPQLPRVVRERLTDRFRRS